MANLKYKEPYVQQRMVKAILANGGEATSRKIKILTGMKMSQVQRGGCHLKNRGIVKKKVIRITKEEGIPCKLNLYILNKNSMHNVHRLINQIPEGWQK